MVGLQVFPSMMSPQIQIWILDKLLHRDLVNPKHKTNLHLHHRVEYPRTPSGETSFFAADSEALLQPREPSIHQPISHHQFLASKLRWMTLGGQYDWTNKVYPDEEPPPFPQDVATFLKDFFPTIEPQAAIVNFYSPGDTLSVHRDVSEQCQKGLISISIGCDALFVVGNDDSSFTATIRLRSGDAVLMLGTSRYAWHGVPRIIPDTCPEKLRNWPATEPSGPFEQWKGWLCNKRINLNVRQMTDDIR
jgi:alkylated DNA repair protein alkB homolog 1